MAIPFRAKTFGRFELRARVGSGGMAEVFKAFDSRSQEIVALKRMLPSFEDDEEIQDLTQLFQAEARIGATLKHRHIAQLLDFGRVSEFFYITFEFIDGRDVSALQAKLTARNELLATPLVCALVIAIADALEYAHARRDADGTLRPVIHRDVSPQNILVSKSGSLKLIDFGVAKDVDSAPGRSQVGAVQGKFGYLAPEQVDGSTVDARTDVFALAVVAWELFSGQRLFHAQNEFLSLQRLTNHVPGRLASLRPDFSIAISDVIAGALSKDRDLRPPTMGAFRDALRTASGVATAAAYEADFAALMDRVFGDNASYMGPLPTPQLELEQAVSLEKRTMSGNEKQDGKQSEELDVFEALSKKRRSLPPPAPSAMSLKGTMFGMASPIAPLAPAPAEVVAAAHLPAVSLESPSFEPAPPSPPPALAAPPAAPAVDWAEDEDEATQVFDKGGAAAMMAMAFAPQAPKNVAAPSAATPSPAAAKTLFGVSPPAIIAGLSPAAPAAPAAAVPVPALAPAPAHADGPKDLAAPSSYALIQSASVALQPPNALLSTAASPSVSPPAAPAPQKVLSHPPSGAQQKATNWTTIGAVAAAALGGAIFLFMPKTGKLVVNISDHRGAALAAFDVQLDGVTICTSLPCVRDKLPIGTKTVSVHSTGFGNPAPKTVSIETSKSSIVDFSLSPEVVTAPPPAVPAVAPAAAVAPPALAPLALAAAPSIAPAPVAVIAAPAPVAPKPAFVAAPPVPAAPVAPKPTWAAPPAAPVAPKPAFVGAPPASSLPAPPPRPAVVAAPPPPGALAGMGLLIINSVPPSSVKIDGRVIGATPISNFSIKAGKHTITFENADEGLTKTIDVDVAPGETKRAIARLRSE